MCFSLGTFTKLDIRNLSMVPSTAGNLLPASLSVQGEFVALNYAFFFVVTLVDTGTGQFFAPSCVPTILGALSFFSSFNLSLCQFLRGVSVLGVLTEWYISNLFLVSPMVDILLLASFSMQFEFAARNDALSSVTMVVDSGTGLFFGAFELMAFVAAKLRAPSCIPTILGAPTFSFPCLGLRDPGEFPISSASFANSFISGQGPCLFIEDFLGWLTRVTFGASSAWQMQKLYSVFSFLRTRMLYCFIGTRIVSFFLVVS